ncbi:uncharacterized protein JN550_011577 [Neoarthrinium moseri]|uniref:uncharacterized protein n=1 Tax=Neoarthrinium moseri TaxID=1658444 RepID=UPI001FDD32A9|nr:uncharacterized protein JN550_011577 [Neoarthrinium moseri]KAI1860311.1 hypothetical protein JN550_011577 [Neoarthrinium moseri]
MAANTTKKKGTIECLPVELVQRVYGELDLPSITAFALTSRRFYETLRRDLGIILYKVVQNYVGLDIMPLAVAHFEANREEWKSAAETARILKSVYIMQIIRSLMPCNTPAVLECVLPDTKKLMRHALLLFDRHGISIPRLVGKNGKAWLQQELSQLSQLFLDYDDWSIPFIWPAHPDGSWSWLVGPGEVKMIRRQDLRVFFSRHPQPEGSLAAELWLEHMLFMGCHRDPGIFSFLRKRGDEILFWDKERMKKVYGDEEDPPHIMEEIMDAFVGQVVDYTSHRPD